MTDPASPTPAAGAAQHRREAPRSVRAAVMTISDTRTPDTDESGRYLAEQLTASGHELVERLIVRDDAVEIRSAVVQLMRVADVVLTSGGTGIAGRDVTVPVIESLLVKPIPGFGELFRMLSYGQVRGAAMLSRALGGMGRGALVFALPGSLGAVQTAWEGILRDELGHLVYEMVRQGQPQARPAAPIPAPAAREALFTDLSSPPPLDVPGTPLPAAPASDWGGHRRGAALGTAGEAQPGVKLGRHSQHPSTYERTPLVRPSDTARTPGEEER
ncbi:MogA/MoaB family molybdenum cofactor biosynthesis protein [Deinococcus sp. PESE-13]